MDHSQATYEAFDGVRLELLGDVVVTCDALRVSEAVRYLRLSEDVADAWTAREAGEDHDLSALDTIVREFPARIGVLDVRLEDIGLDVEGPNGEALSFGGLTVKDGLELADLLGLALSDPYDTEASRAKVRVLDEFPETFGLGADLDAGSVFEVARAFAGELYLLIYGLAMDFCAALTASPPIRAMKLRAPGRNGSSPTPASTT